MNTSFLKRWWFWPLLVGLLLRFVLMPLTYHPDLLGHSSVAYFFAYEGVTNPYEHLLSLDSDHPLVKNIGVSDVFIYPPLAYFTLGLFRVIVKPFTDPEFVPYLWQNLSLIYEHKALMWHLFAYKFPYIFFDVGVGLLLAALFDDVKKKRLAFLLWMLNPLTLYATFMLGQLDLLPTFFMVLSFYFIKKDKPYLAMASLGVGGSYKMFPLLLIVPVAFYLSTNFKKRILLLLSGVAPFALVTLPYLASPAFRQMVLFSPKSQKMLFMIWKMTSAEGVYPFILILSLIYFFTYYAKKFDLLPQILGILLLIFSVTHFHPQWFLWVTPLIIFELVKNDFKHVILSLILFGGWLFITFMFEPSLTIGLFSPVNPGLQKVAGLESLLSGYTDVYQIKSLVRSFFAAASLYYVYSVFKETKGLSKK